MKKKSLLKIVSGFIFLICVLSACAPSKLILSSEETHKLCEIYADDVEWARNFYNGASYFSLKDVVNHYKNLDKLLLCSFEITSAEVVPNELENDERTFINLVMKVKETHIGNPAEAGKEFTQLAFQENNDISNLVGKTYVGFVEISEYYALLYSPWMLLVVEDNTLVSPFGCQVDEVQSNSQLQINNNFHMECRDYTGQKLDYFISVVKELEAETDAETSTE